MVTRKLLNENKFDNLIRMIVRDIVFIFKKHRKGYFELPEDIRGGHSYETSKPQGEISVDLIITLDDTIDTVDVTAEYYNQDYIIRVAINYNPNKKQKIIYELIGELNEAIGHELQHFKQHEDQYVFPKKEPKSSIKYFSQPHELDALQRGFKRRAKIEKKDYESVIRNFFEKYKHKQKLKPFQIEFLVNKLLSEK